MSSPPGSGLCAGAPPQAESIRPMISSSISQIMARISSRLSANSDVALMSRRLSSRPRAANGRRYSRSNASGARGHDEQAFAEEQGFFHAVGDEDDRLAGVAPQLQDQGLHLLPRQRVQRPQRLVHQDELRVVGEAAGQGDALLHAARQLVDRLVPEPLEADGVEQVLHPGGDLAGRCAAHLRAEADVLGDVQPLEQRALLEHHPALRRGGGDLVRAEHRLPAGGGEESGEDVEKGGLAAPRRPEHRQDAARIELEGNVPQGFHAAALRELVDHGDTLHGKAGFVHGVCSATLHRPDCRTLVLVVPGVISPGAGRSRRWSGRSRPGPRAAILPSRRSSRPR